jgi:outer membrane biosynthesis protein TonB
MKALVIQLNGREIERFALDRPTIFIGRSPSCDVVLRVKGVKPLHYLIDWVGEGTFNPDKGFWTLIDLSTEKKDQARGEGLILSAEVTSLGKFSFGFTQDDWIEKEIAKGKLKKQVDQAVADEASIAAGMNDYCLEMVSVRSDSDRVEDVTHTKYFSPRNQRWLINAKSPIKFQWQDPSKAFLEFMPTGEKWDIKNRDEFLHDGVFRAPQKFEMTPRDVIIASNEGHQYYVRLVPRIRIQAQWKRNFFDPMLLALLALIFITFTLAQLFQRAGQVEEQKKEPPRIVKVELPPQPKPEPPPAPSAPAPEKTAKVVEPKEPTKVKKAPEVVAEKPKQKKAEAPAAAATITKNPGNPKLTTPNKGSKPGLPGVLGVLRKGSGGAKPLKADTLIANRNASELDSEPSSSAVAVARSSPGALTGSKNTGSANGVDLNSAGTSVKGGFVTNPGEGGISGKDTGTLGSGALAGAKAAGRGTGFGSSGSFGNQTEIEGGLDSDAVRRAIKEYAQQFRSCYENYLTSSKKKDESGRVTLVWVIRPDGHVTNNSIANSNFSGRELGICIKSVVDKILFPKAPNGQPTRVRYPFIFQNKK